MADRKFLFKPTLYGDSLEPKIHASINIWLLIRQEDIGRWSGGSKMSFIHLWFSSSYNMIDIRTHTAKGIKEYLKHNLSQIIYALYHNSLEQVKFGKA
ncbi:MAG: hypothetical protein ACI8PB_003219 [Desulforhopalus sp.]|jgi:hypothetical protein